MAMYAKWFFGFDPETRPIITFSQASNRDALLRVAKPGEVIVFVGTNGENTPEQYRGKVLGAAEIGRKSVKSEEVVDLSTAPAAHFENGRYRWPEAIPMLRAWRFDPPPAARGLLRMSGAAQFRAVTLSKENERVIRALSWNEVRLPDSAERTRQLALKRALGGRSRPGPVQGPQGYTVDRQLPDRAWTYALRFGKSAIWKLGRTANLDNRLQEINAHIPFEYLKEQWQIFLSHEWPTETDAQAMEQRVLNKLAAHCTHGERVRCTESVLRDAWLSAVSG